MYQSTILDFLGIGGGELALIMVAILLLFGGKKLPELARGLGKGIREFKDASEDVKREIQRNINSVTTEEEEEKKEELNHSEYHHPTEDQQLVSSADVDYNHPATEDPQLQLTEDEEYNHTEGSSPHLEEEIKPVKGKESHIE